MDNRLKGDLGTKRTLSMVKKGKNLTVPTP